MKLWSNDKHGIRLYNCDSRELTKALDECDVVSTDPPYGIAHPCNFKTRGRDKLASCNDYPDVHGDDEPFDPAWLLGKPCVLWGANWFADVLPPSGGWLVWDKKRPDTLDQATCELAWTNWVKGVRRFTHLWHGCMKASERGESYHPTQKPVALYEWVLSLKWAKNFRMVFDPYMGAGPGAVACVRKGLRFVGAELSEQYFDIAVSRTEKAIREKEDGCEEEGGSGVEGGDADGDAGAGDGGAPERVPGVHRGGGAGGPHR